MHIKRKTKKKEKELGVNRWRVSILKRWETACYMTIILRFTDLCSTKLGHAKLNI